MAISITFFKDELAGILHGTNINDVHYENGVILRAARQLLADVDLFETKRTTQLTTPLYSDIFSYQLPVDVKMDRIFDLKPQVNRSIADRFDQRVSRDFDQYKENDTFSVDYDSGVKTINVSKKLNQPLQITGFETTTNWSVGGDATNLTRDTQYCTQGSASLNFDLSGAGTSGFIENSSLQNTNLSQHVNISRLFLDVYFPDSSIITNVNLRWGNDSSNYFEVTSTSPFNQSAFVDGWNTIDFDWNGAAETGTVDSSAVDYVRVTITYDGTADTDLRVDNLRSILGEIYEVSYYSQYMFQDATTNALKATIDSDNDSIILEDHGVNLLLFKTAEYAAQQAQQQGYNVDVQYFSNEFERLKREYQSKYPSGAIKRKTAYYRMNTRHNRRPIRWLK